MRLSQRREPFLAIWLLERTAIKDCVESLTGDLIENYETGRSAASFWTQMLAVVFVCVWQKMRTQKLVAISGAVTGLASLWCLTVLGMMALVRYGLMVHAVDWRWPHYILLFIIGFACTAGSGWVVGRLHRAHRTAAVFGFLVSVFIVPTVELPLLYWFAPSVFFSTIVPHFPFFLVVSVIGAPLSILFGGFYRTSEGVQANDRSNMN